MNIGVAALTENERAWSWEGGGLVLGALGFGDGAESCCQNIYPAGTCRLVFCLEGSLELHAAGVNAPQDCRLTPERAALLYYPHQCGARDKAAEAAVRCLSIHLSALRFAALLGNGGLEGVLKSAIAAGRPLAVVQPLGSAAARTLARVVAAIASREEPSLLLVMYLVELAWRFAGRPDPSAAAGACAADQRAVQQVRCFLEENLSRPPSLKVLAGRAGMSVSKLKLLFPRTCGAPPLAYLRQVRLEKARSLLMYSKMNVTEVAMEVGYTSLSHFSKAFAERYGVAPSRLRQARPASKEGNDLGAGHE